MKKKSLFLASAATLLSLGCLTGCSLGSNSIVVWVGSESVKFYREEASKFLKANPDFGLKISIVGADTGGAAGQMVSDNTACGDIITVAHDNIGKLSQLSYIAPIIDEEVLAQIDADNPAAFKSVIKNILGDGRDGFTYTFGVPYISQALFLYYDTRYVTDEEAETFESLAVAAKRYDTENGVSGTRAVTVTGTDGFNFSFPLLARKLYNPDDETQNSSSLRIYEEGNPKDCYAQDNDQVAIMKWLQRYSADPNGIYLTSGSKWETDIANHQAISVIGGAWHYNSFHDAVTDMDGNTHMGVKMIPTFTLTADDVAGIEATSYPEDPDLPEAVRGAADEAPVAGTKYRGGSFVDCKCFVINMTSIMGKNGPEKYTKMCKLLKYFSSKEVQNDSFVEALNVPAYEGSSEFIESVKGQVEDTAYLMGKAQTGMGSYGISQPFLNATLNANYYQDGAPDYYKNCILKKDGAGSDVKGIREVLWRMEYVWKWGAPAASSKYPTSYPAETHSKRHGSAA